MFFIGLITLFLTAVGLYTSGAIFDTAKKTSIETFFFQPNNLSSQRPGVPKTAEELGATKIIEMLLGKYISEYFYVTPNAEDIAYRSSNAGTLYNMSSAAVFSDWVQTEGEEIQELSSDKVFRTANIIGDIMPPDSRSVYWTVNYELKTWYTPNNLDEKPVVSRGKMYLDLVYEQGVRDSIIDYGVQKYLSSGGDAAILFKFRVLAIERE